MGLFGSKSGSGKGNDGKHRIGRQQATGKTRKSSAKSKATGKHGKDQGKHRGGGSGRGGAADGLDRWG